MKNRNQIDPRLLSRLENKYTYKSVVPLPLAEILLDTKLSSRLQDHGLEIEAARTPQNREIPDKIQDSLENKKEQMMVREHTRQEFFLPDFGMNVEDDQYGFVVQVKKNRLTKQRINISFNTASSLFHEYFQNRFAEFKLDLSTLLRKP